MDFEAEDEELDLEDDHRISKPDGDQKAVVSASVESFVVHSGDDDNDSEGKEGSIGETWLFFGCRNRKEDFLYRDDFEQLAKDGTLKHLQLAFSREQEHKVYVQHRITEHASELYDLIFNQQAYIFVCG